MNQIHSRELPLMPGRLVGDHLSTSSHAIIQVSGSFRKHMAFLPVLQNTENVRAVGEFRSLILATMVWVKVLVGFHSCYMHFLQFRKQKYVKNSCNS